MTAQQRVALRGLGPRVGARAPGEVKNYATSVRVAVADDAVLLREGLVRILAEDGLEVVGAVGDVDGLLDGIQRTGPDLVIGDPWPRDAWATRVGGWRSMTS